MKAISWLAMTAILGGAAACGGGGGSGDDVDAATGTPDAPAGTPDAPPSSSEVTVTIGAAGGTITLDDVTLTFPPGAVTADTDFTLSREDAVFLAPNGAPDGFCQYKARYRLVPPTTFALDVSLEMIVNPATPTPTIGLSDVGMTTFSEVAGTRAGNLVTVPLPHTGRFFAGAQYATAFSPPYGLPTDTITLTTPGRSGLTAVKLRAADLTYPGQSPVVYGDAAVTFQVPNIAPELFGPHAVEMVFAPWKCGDVPGTFYLGGA